MAVYMGQSLLQEGEVGNTCIPCWAGYLFLDYKKGAKPQPYSCPQVASSEPGLTALGPCSHCLGGRSRKIGDMDYFQIMKDVIPFALLPPSTHKCRK